MSNNKILVKELENKVISFYRIISEGTSNHLARSMAKIKPSEHTYLMQTNAKYIRAHIVNRKGNCRFVYQEKQIEKIKELEKKSIF